MPGKPGRTGTAGCPRGRRGARALAVQRSGPEPRARRRGEPWLELAATIAGWAPAGLLDTYQTERHPIAAWVLDWTRAQVALLRGDEWTAQLRKVVDDELFTVRGVMNRVVALTSGITQHYDAADTAAPAGSIAGDVEVTSSGGRLADYARDGRFVLVDRSPDGRFAGPVSQLERRVACVADPTAGTSQPSLLVRPDGIIAWADTRDAEHSGDDSQKQLAAALERWVGA